jgi:hypothetical protein
MLSLYPRTELAKDAKVPFGPPKTGEFSIGHAVTSKAESTPCSPRPKPPEPRSPTNRTTVYGGSTPATFATPTDTCGRSCTTHGSSGRNSNRIVKDQRQG